jgi:hypothetical protein
MKCFNRFGGGVGMRILRLGIWGIIVLSFVFLASIPVVWASPEQSSLNQTLPPATAVATVIVDPGTGTPTGDGTPTATVIPLLPPSGNDTQGNGFFILTGSFLIGGALLLLLSAQWKRKQLD